MKITNNYNLPQSIVNAISFDERVPKENYISVTRLIDSPLIHQLMKEHWDDIKQDASSMLWSLLGKAVHYVLDNFMYEIKEYEASDEDIIKIENILSKASQQILD